MKSHFTCKSTNLIYTYTYMYMYIIIFVNLIWLVENNWVNNDNSTTKKSFSPKYIKVKMVSEWGLARRWRLMYWCRQSSLKSVAFLKITKHFGLLALSGPGNSPQVTYIALCNESPRPDYGQQVFSSYVKELKFDRKKVSYDTDRCAIDQWFTLTNRTPKKPSLYIE